MRKKKEAQRKSQLHHHMRHTYEAFSRVLRDEVCRLYPKDFQTHQKIDKALQTLLTEHFGEVTSAEIFYAG